MNWLDLLALIGLAIAAFAAIMTLKNLQCLRKPELAPDHPESSLVVCIPARNESANIEDCVRSVLGGGIEQLTVLIYDDQSDDGTGAIVTRLAAEDSRVRSVPTHPMPAGWCGKQHACWRLAQFALDTLHDDDWMLFLDADVRIEPGGLRLAMASAASPAGAARLGLVSTFPKQRTETLGEALLVTSIFFILLSYLPFRRMQTTLDPAASAACGQFMLVRASCYQAFGGHEALRDSMHDGVKMPRLARKAGWGTDLFSGVDVASCRMYRGFKEAWDGFAKNAYEGLGNIWLLSLLTVLHLVGHILPVPLLLIAVLASTGDSVRWVAILAAAAAIFLGIAQRMVIASHQRHTAAAAPLHALGVLLMTLVQWWSLYLSLRGRRSWRGRTLTADLAA